MAAAAEVPISRTGVVSTMQRVFLVAVVGGCALLGGALAGLLAPRLEPQAAAQRFSSGLPHPTSDVLKLGDRFEVVARQVAPAVVAVEATKVAAAQGNGKAKPVEESGSG